MPSLAERFDQQSVTRRLWKKRHWYYHKEIEDLVGFIVPKGASVLEIGCGTGELLAVLEPQRGLGIDLSPKMIELASRTYSDSEWQIADVASFGSVEKFDYIVLSDVLGHLEDVGDVFQNLRKNCTSRTRIVITYYNYLWEPVLRLAEYLGLKEKQPLQHWLSPDDIDNLLYLSGYETIKKGRKTLLPIYIPLLSGFFNRIIGNLPFLNRICLIQYAVARPITPSNTDYSVSVIVPARNEKGNIESLLKRLPKIGLADELIFVEGHSKDGTFDEIKRVCATYAGPVQLKYFRQPGKGKADAVRAGFKAASGDILMILDADLSVPPEELPKFYEALRSGRADFANGSRLVYPMEKQAMRFLNVLANKFFGLAFSWLLGQKIKDTLCGTKVIFRHDYEQLVLNRAYFGEFDPFGDFDLLLGAAKLNLKIVDLPVHYKERTYGTTQISRFKHGWLLLKMCFFAARKLKSKA